MSLLEPLLVLPVLPATVLLGLLMVWSLIAIMGGAVLHGDMHVDADAHLDAHMDAHMDADAHVDAGSGMGEAIAHWGAYTLSWLNINQMPLLIWLAAFSLLWWIVSVSLWLLIDARLLVAPGAFWSSLLIGRNLVISALLTKLMTNPMRGWYVGEELTAQSLIGQECEICSSEATPEYGQVRYKTDGAPLLLNVRTDGPHLCKGARVWITHYDAKRRAYIVSPTSQGN